MLPAGTVIPALLPEPTDNFTTADAIQMRKLIEEHGRRKAESLRIYEPLPKLNIFHETNTKVRLLIGSNRAGKTLGAATEYARAVTGRDPYNKWPKENGIFFVFGLDGRHIGNTIYKKVFRAGAFKMIRDEHTGVWRAFSPILDAARSAEAKPAPPLVPARFIKSIAWDEKKAHIPKIITTINGWETHFYSSQAELPQGQDIDGFWIDEEVKKETVIEELLPRLADRKGKGFWSATPQVASTQLFELHDRANSGQKYGTNGNASISEDGDVVEVHALIVDNPHIDQQEKDSLFRSWTEEQRLVRWYGKFAFTSFLVYPEFTPAVHAWPHEHWTPPHDWALYVATDPGRQRCGVLFIAVPPPYLGNFIVAYAELYIKDCDAEIYGRKTAEKGGNRSFEANIIDSHAGRVNEMASGRNIEEQYRQALVKHKFKMRNTVGFTWGSDDVDGGLQAVRDLLRVQGGGQPRMFIYLPGCPHLKWEFERYRYKPDPKTNLPTDVPIKKNDHLMDCLRYLAAFRPQWRKPAQPRKVLSGAVDAMRRKKDRKKQKGRQPGEGGGIHLGIGSSR